MAVPPVKPLHAHPTANHACPMAQAMLDAFYHTDHTQCYAHPPAPPSVSAAPDTDFTTWTPSPANAISTPPGYTPDQSSSSGWSSFTSSSLPSPPEDLSILEQEIASFFRGWTPQFTEAVQQSISLDFSIPHTSPTLSSQLPYSCQTPDPSCTQDSILHNFTSYAQLPTPFR
jgi:hypothetical protein